MAHKRISKELKETNYHHIAPYDDDDLMKLRGIIFGPPDTPYENFCFEVQIDINPQYPFKEPELSIKGGIYHPSFTLNGKYYPDKDGPSIFWSPSCTLDKTLDELENLLFTPAMTRDTFCYTSNEVFSTFMLRRSLFYVNAYKHCKEHAMNLEIESNEWLRSGFEKSKKYAKMVSINRSLPKHDLLQFYRFRSKLKQDIRVSPKVKIPTLIQWTMQVLLNEDICGLIAAYMSYPDRGLEIFRSLQ